MLDPKAFRDQFKQGRKKNFKDRFHTAPANASQDARNGLEKGQKSPDSPYAALHELKEVIRIAKFFVRLHELAARYSVQDVAAAFNIDEENAQKLMDQAERVVANKPAVGASRLGRKRKRDGKPSKSAGVHLFCVPLMSRRWCF